MTMNGEIKSLWNFLYRIKFDKAGHWFTTDDDEQINLTLYFGTFSTKQNLKWYVMIVGPLLFNIAYI